MNYTISTSVYLIHFKYKAIKSFPNIINSSTSHLFYFLFNKAAEFVSHCDL